MFARIFSVMAALVVSGGAQAAPAAPQDDTSIAQRLAKAQIKINAIADIAAPKDAPRPADQVAQHHPFNQHFNQHHDWRNHH